MQATAPKLTDPFRPNCVRQAYTKFPTVYTHVPVILPSPRTQIPWRCLQSATIASIHTIFNTKMKLWGTKNNNELNWGPQTFNKMSYNICTIKLHTKLPRWCSKNNIYTKLICNINTTVLIVFTIVLSTVYTANAVNYRNCHANFHTVY
jgi:hypothetical protein